MSNMRKVYQSKFGFLILDPLIVGVLSLFLALGIYHIFDFKNDILSCWAISVLIFILRVSYNWEKNEERIFRDRYVIVHQTRLSKEQPKYHHQYKEHPEFYFFLVFGAGIFGYGVYILMAGYIWALIIILVGSGFIYQVLKPKKEIKIGNKGIWSTEFGFIYITSIQKIEYYSSTGKFTSRHVKLYIHNHNLYELKRPYLQLSIMNYENESSLKEELLKLK
ncbi:hypothetical protein LZQ00_07315 [Sphingobacterium sp. SRCM116780]|uniref:hypothetical protein n=1 Tax=Sphingobacterium sp. SRCM116780 TaxID=2907623 RepID=UPI001F25CCF3|nr:hypothetical protein [Sphingobacterium sp. SRCM116780]UIR57619.1 hypothetical protein LZQ00_07315 [Sphingobacterium sp. SRCM116780]